MASILEWISSPISSAISGIGNVIGQSQANKANIQAVRETNQANRELAEYNWQQQIDMWNRQNEYNTPTAQMSRLRDAGLNPHLVYGNGVTGNNAGSTPTPQLAHMEAPRQEALRYGDAFQGFAEGMMNLFAMKNAQKDLELKDSQIAAQSVENRLRLAQMMEHFQNVRNKSWDLKKITELFPFQLKAAELDIAKREKDNYRLDMEIDNMGLQFEISRQNLWMSKAQLQVLFKQIDRVSADIAEAWSRIALNNANTEKVKQEKSNLEEIFKSLGIENEIKGATKETQIGIIKNQLLHNFLKYDIDREEYNRMLLNLQNFSIYDAGAWGRTMAVALGLYTPGQ